MDSPPTQVATAEARIALLEARIAELEAEPAGDAPRSRRQLLRLAGAAVVGTVAATTAAGKAAADDSFNTFMPGNPIDFNTPDVTRINYVGLEGEAAVGCRMARFVGVLLLLVAACEAPKECSATCGGCCTEAGLCVDSGDLTCGRGGGVWA